MIFRIEKDAHKNALFTYSFQMIPTEKEQIVFLVRLPCDQSATNSRLICDQFCAKPYTPENPDLFPITAKNAEKKNRPQGS